MDAFDREMEEWRSFESSLRQDNRVLFAKMVADIKEDWPAIEVASNKDPTEVLLTPIMLRQQKMIRKPIGKIESPRHAK